MVKRLTHPRLDDLRRQLRASEIEDARATTVELLRESTKCNVIMRRLPGPWIARGHQDQFIDLLFEHRSLVFGHLGLLVMTMKAVGEDVWSARFAPELETILCEDPDYRIAFAETDFLNPLTKHLTSEMLKLAARVKWHGWPETSPDSVFAVCEQQAERLQIQSAVADFFWECSLHQHLGREEWLRQVQAATIFEHLIGDIRYLLEVPELTSLTSRGQVMLPWREGAKLALSALSGPRLLVTWHGSIFSAVIHGYKDVKDGVRVVSMNATPSTEFVITTGPDRPNAAFLMLKSILGGRVVMLAGDLAPGSNDRQVDILGVNMSMAKGASFVAAESRCPTMFYSVERSNDGFVPILIEGPRRQAETADEFEDKWFSFYTDSIERSLTGDPRNLPLRGIVVNNIIRHIFRDVS